MYGNYGTFHRQNVSAGGCRCGAVAACAHRGVRRLAGRLTAARSIQHGAYAASQSVDAGDATQLLLHDHPVSRPRRGRK